MNKFDKYKIPIFISLNILVLISLFGMAYAYFKATVNNAESASTISVESGELTINYQGNTANIVASGIIPGWSETKKFTLSGKNTTKTDEFHTDNNLYYKIILAIDNNTFSEGALTYSLAKDSTSSTNGKMADEASGTINQSGNQIIGYGYFSETSTFVDHIYNLTISFPSTEYEQSADNGKSFAAHVTIVEGETISEYISKLDKASNGLEEDNTPDKNIRYVGANPKNYVEFANTGELWRIIGVFNVKDSTGKVERKIKLVRNESLGAFSWDAKLNPQTNDYRGINDWTKADLMNELNGDYLDTTLTANKNNWYNSYWDSSTNKPVLRQTGVFDYTKVIKSNYQNMISESVWNIGGNSYTGSAPYTLNLLSQYNKERGTITYQNSRPTEWTGKVGLIYASDYGYASTLAECHENLRAGVTYENDSWDYTNGKCKTDNWLFKNSWYWTLSPYSGTSDGVFIVRGGGAVDGSGASNSFGVFPAVFLKSDILIASGTGEKDSPYRLG
ncbi:MAG: hypothetical protein J6K23_04725 [Bacilli bacterium]|nr:hypothetical protein [Bacilli bacterium]